MRSMAPDNHRPLVTYQEYPIEEMQTRAAAFRDELWRRRSVRTFSDRFVPRQIIEDCVMAAASAPSGANQQPWRFVVVGDASLKHEIRLAAEAEEREFYAKRAPQDWLSALAPLGTNANKPFLEIAPYLIIIFAETYGVAHNGDKIKNYYVNESVGIATGMLITALHHVGLATLTHTPSPMGFLNQILQRPENERPFLLLVVGYPASNTTVPIITKKTIDEIALFL